jgi:hypothetical protein
VESWGAPRPGLDPPRCSEGRTTAALQSKALLVGAAPGRRQQASSSRGCAQRPARGAALRLEPGGCGLPLALAWAPSSSLDLPGTHAGLACLAVLPQVHLRL